MWKRLTISALTVVALALVCLRPWPSLRAQPPQNAGASLFDPSLHTLLIRYGVTDKVEKTWRGRARAGLG